MPIGGLAELEFDGSGAALGQAVLGYAADIVIAVHLQNDLAIAVIVLAEGADHILEQLALLDLGILTHQAGVLINGTLTDHSQHTGHSGAAKVLGPGQLCHGRQHHRQFELDGIAAADLGLHLHMEHGSLSRTLRGTHGTEYPAIDVEVGQIHRIFLFRTILVYTAGCGIDSVGTAHCSQADLTQAGAFAADRAHARTRGGMLRVTQTGLVECGTELGTVRHEIQLLLCMDRKSPLPAAPCLILKSC